MFLVRFPLIRELVYGSGDENGKAKSKRGGASGSQSDDNLQLRRSARLRQKKDTE